MPSGGPRTPAHPAPVSGPGALSRRTDGGPGQPVRAAAGGSYGDRKATVQQQQAAPLAAGGPQTGSGPASAQAAPASPMAGGIFGPTNRPDEPITAGIPSGPGSDGAGLSSDPNQLLHAIYQMFPNQDLARILGV